MLFFMLRTRRQVVALSLSLPLFGLLDFSVFLSIKVAEESRVERLSNQYHKPKPTSISQHYLTSSLSNYYEDISNNISISTLQSSALACNMPG
jgi:hypothetical protein